MILYNIYWLRLKKPILACHVPVQYKHIWPWDKGCRCSHVFLGSHKECQSQQPHIPGILLGRKKWNIAAGPLLVTACVSFVSKPLNEPKGEVLLIYFQFRKTKPELQVLGYSLSMIIIVAIIIIIKNNLGRNASSLKILHLDKMLTLKGSSGWAELQENAALTALYNTEDFAQGKAEYTWQHCVLSQCKYNSCQLSSLQSSQDGFSQQSTPWQQPDSVTATDHSTLSDTDSPPSIQVQRLTWNNLHQALVRHRLAQTCWLHLTQFQKLAWELCKDTPSFLKKQNHAGKRKPCWCSASLSVWLWKGKKIEAKYLTRTHGSAFLISKARAKQLSVT